MLPGLQRVMPDGVRVTDIQFRQATFIETSIANVKRVLVEALACRCARAVRVPAQLANDRHFPHRHSAIRSDDRHCLPASWGSPSTP